MNEVFVEKLPTGQQNPFGGKTRIVVKGPNGEEAIFYSRASHDDDKLADWMENEEPFSVCPIEGNNSVLMSSTVTAEVRLENETIKLIWFSPPNQDNI